MIDQLREVQRVLEQCPAGGIGRFGPTLSDLLEYEKHGDVCDGNASYHTCQKAWRLIQLMIQELMNAKELQ